jgi:guanylate kinase
VGLGRLIVVSAPSGTGKSTLLKRLLEQDRHCRFSVSHTTRAARQGEEDGRDYHFVQEAQFQDLIAREAFLEHAQVHGHRYGTSRLAVEKLCSAGFDVILDIDVVGARIVRRKRPDCLSLFILPPDFQQLASRLKDRGTDGPDVIARRLVAAQEEVQAVGEYDFVLINQNLDLCGRQLAEIIACDRLRTARQKTRIQEILAAFRQNP